MKELQHLDIKGLDLGITVDDSTSSAMDRLNDFGSGPVHHPPCPRHDDHLLYIRGRPFCLGCVFSYTGMVLGVPIFLLFYFFFNPGVLALALLGFLIAFLPSLLQIKVQIKLYKIFSRTSLGIGISLYLASIILLLPLDMEGFVLRIGGIVFMVGVAYGTQHLRNQFGKTSHCAECPEGEFPICTFRLPLIKNMIGEMEEKGEQKRSAYDFLMSSRRQIEEKDGSTVVKHRD